MRVVIPGTAKRTQRGQLYASLPKLKIQGGRGVPVSSRKVEMELERQQ